MLELERRIVIITIGSIKPLYYIKDFINNTINGGSLWLLLRILRD